MRVDCIPKKQGNKVYYSYLLRHGYRDKDGKVKHKLIANLTGYSQEEIDAIKLALKYKKDLSCIRSIKEFRYKVLYSIGAVYLLYQIARRLGIERSLGRSEEGKLILWQVISRLIYPCSKLGSVRLAMRHAILEVLKMDSFCEDDVYNSLKWLDKRHEEVERRMIEEKSKEELRLLMYDITSSYLEGNCNEYGDYGYNRDGKRGKKQIVLGLLTDRNGDPVGVEVYRGNTSDIRTFKGQVDKVKKRYGIEGVVFIGDKGIIKGESEVVVKENGFHYISSITKSRIEKLVNEKVLQMSLFDKDIKEVLTDEGIRYILRRNPFRAEELRINRMKKEEVIKKMIKEQNRYLRSHKRAKVEVSERKVREKIEKLEMNWVRIEVEGRKLVLKRDKRLLNEIRKLDGCYVIKSDVKKSEMTAKEIHDRYKDLSKVERAFRSIKTGCLKLRPIYLRKANHTRAHTLIVMMSYRIERYLEKCWEEVNIKLEEGIEELSKICILEVENKERRHYIIAEGSDIAQKLLKLTDVRLPETIKIREKDVYTRKKLRK